MNQPTTVTTEPARPTLHILIGIQASGKSTFASKQLRSASRINLDTLKSRRKESALFQELLSRRVDILIDNTNPTRSDRLRYIPSAQAAGYQVFAYRFVTDLASALRRNSRRPRPVPIAAIRGTHSRMEKPHPDEGFSKIFRVTLRPGGEFLVSPAKNFK